MTDALAYKVLTAPEMEAFERDGVFAFRGQMVDAPLLRQAEAVVRRHVQHHAALGLDPEAGSGPGHGEAPHSLGRMLRLGAGLAQELAAGRSGEEQVADLDPCAGGARGRGDLALAPGEGRGLRDAIRCDVGDGGDLDAGHLGDLDDDIGAHLAGADQADADGLAGLASQIERLGQGQAGGGRAERRLRLDRGHRRNLSPGHMFFD